tara:strand:+ start:35653 stop:35838 length:186 start_codon:yes stop_codon:yes gene_type:complete
MKRDFLDSMIEHNRLVGINNFYLDHFDMTYDEYKNLPSGKRYVCVDHFEENCTKCEKINKY